MAYSPLEVYLRLFGLRDIDLALVACLFDPQPVCVCASCAGVKV